MHSRSNIHEGPAGLDIPLWVALQLGGKGSAACATASHVIEGLRVASQSANGLAVFSCVVEQAATMDQIALRQAAERAYTAISALCDAQSAARYPLRYWNFIPAINEIVGDGLNRYMVFNLGRHAAMAKRFGPAGAINGLLPTATGIGHHAHYLAVHCLAGSSRPLNVENPQQIPAFRYSAAYGPKPPCFSRASWTSIRGTDILLVGGTSSVRGETSVHRDDMRAQLNETIENLRALVVAACEARGRPVRRERALDGFRHARAYFVQPEDGPVIAAELRQLMPNLEDLEVKQAQICRAELRVEIEGVVDVRVK